MDIKAQRNGRSEPHTRHVVRIPGSSGRCFRLHPDNLCDGPKGGSRIAGQIRAIGCQSKFNSSFTKMAEFLRMESDEYAQMSQSAFEAISWVAEQHDCDIEEVIFASFLQLNAMERRAKLTVIKGPEGDE